ncbi:hypothetical protein L227DRAFT_336476 [Lentinus tigrinus ALCF2SS1-6]|uniref:Uncharacterized protein n=1 Tax=Lentinus tigrinus ALCF2SS1-6 TaxID=1328759 RepID=A0A5C2RTG5_9APHY|nr:hypothetical protein L227DRAFT_336476 [Lentinus tigrinus ALCF2SS1-6]
MGAGKVHASLKSWPSNSWYTIEHLVNVKGAHQKPLRPVALQSRLLRLNLRHSSVAEEGDHIHGTYALYCSRSMVPSIFVVRLNSLRWRRFMMSTAEPQPVPRAPGSSTCFNTDGLRNGDGVVIPGMGGGCKQRTQMVRVSVQICLAASNRLVFAPDVQRSSYGWIAVVQFVERRRKGYQSLPHRRVLRSKERHRTAIALSRRRHAGPSNAHRRHRGGDRRTFRSP